MRIKNLLQGMMDSFDKSAAGGLEAIIQFNFIDHPEEKYFLEIKDNDCRLIEGNSKDKDVIINTPFIVWKNICIGKLEGQQALMESKYWIEGDFSLMIKFDELFTVKHGESMEISPFGIGSAIVFLIMNVIAICSFKSKKKNLLLTSNLFAYVSYFYYNKVNSQLYCESYKNHL